MLATLVPATIPPPDTGYRSPGVHVSSIIRCIATETQILKPEWTEELSLVDTSQVAWWLNLDEVARLRIAMGLAWESWYLKQLGHVVPHPGEMQLQGIYLTHDGESLDAIYTESGLTQHLLCLHEVKFTYKSTKTVGNLESQWMWITQMQAYCKALGTRIAYLHVYFACGNYSYPMRPQLKVWRVEFTQDEIDITWETLLEYVKQNQHLLLEDFGQEGA